MSVYDDEPQVSSKLEWAMKYESKTKQVPFIVASELDEVTREFLVFYDLEHYLHQRHLYPRCHELILRYDDYNNTGAGRLAFDFDGPAEPFNLKQRVEQLIINTFRLFYKEIDTSLLIFVWQVTRHSHKFSKHLIVKNAYFYEYWDEQMKMFYNLFRLVAIGEEADDVLAVVDFQIARRNGSMRMIGCSKYGGIPIELESPSKCSIYDCLIGIYDFEHFEKEQRLSSSCLNYTAVIALREEKSLKPAQKKIVSKVISVGSIGKKAEEFEATDAEIEKAVDAFNGWSDGTFFVRGAVRNVVNLQRAKISVSTICPISGKEHQSDNAFLVISRDGKVYFKCRRGCVGKVVMIGVIKEPPKQNPDLPRIRTNPVMLSQLSRIETKHRVTKTDEKKDEQEVVKARPMKMKMPFNLK